MQVKAVACELPKESGQPLSRYSRQDLVREVTQRGIVAKISGRTIWRWLNEDAIRPWQHRSWIFPRDPDFQTKAERVLEQEPYQSADRVFWIVDNGSSHRGAAAVKRLQQAYANVHLIHLPVHASWLNQVEIYFSILQRKVLTPNEFACLEEVNQRLLAFQEQYEQVAKPFEWKFTRADLQELMQKLNRHPPLSLAA